METMMMIAKDYMESSCGWFHYHVLPDKSSPSLMMWRRWPLWSVIRNIPNNFSNVIAHNQISCYGINVHASSSIDLEDLISMFPLKMWLITCSLSITIPTLSFHVSLKWNHEVRWLFLTFVVLKYLWRVLLNLSHAFKKINS